MCLGTVYVTRGGVGEKVCPSITHVNIRGDELVFTDLLGRYTTIRGTIYEMDLNGSFIYVNGQVTASAE